MLNLIQTSNSYVRKINDFANIVNMAKSSKDHVFIVNGDYLFTTDVDATIFKRIMLNIHEDEQFAFMDNHLKTQSGKSLLMDMTKVVLVNGILCREDHIDYFSKSNYTILDNGDIIDKITLDFIPGILTNVSDYWLSMNINKIYYRLNNLMPVMQSFDNNTFSNGVFTYNQFENHPTFLDMSGNKKDLGVFRYQIYDGNTPYVISLFKSIIPFKKNDSISLSISRINDNDFSFYIRITVMRKKHPNIDIYIRCVNLLRREY